MNADAGSALLRGRFGAAPADYSGPFISVPLPDRSGKLLLINTGATSAEIDALNEPARGRQRDIIAWAALALVASVFAAIWLAASGSASAAWIAPAGTAALGAAAGTVVYRAQGEQMVAEQAKAIASVPSLVRSPLLPGQGRRSLGAGIADHFQNLPAHTDDDTERQIRYEMSFWLHGYAAKYGTSDESAGMIELMNAEASLKTLRSLQKDKAARSSGRRRA